MGSLGQPREAGTGAPRDHLESEARAGPCLRKGFPEVLTVADTRGCPWAGESRAPWACSWSCHFISRKLKETLGCWQHPMHRTACVGSEGHAASPHLSPAVDPHHGAPAAWSQFWGLQAGDSGAVPVGSWGQDLSQPASHSALENPAGATHPVPSRFASVPAVFISSRSRIIRGCVEVSPHRRGDPTTTPGVCHSRDPWFGRCRGAGGEELAGPRVGSREGRAYATPQYNKSVNITSVHEDFSPSFPG